MDSLLFKFPAKKIVSTGNLQKLLLFSYFRHCCKYAKIFSGTYFHVQGDNHSFCPYTGKFESEKTHILAYFTQCRKKDFLIHKGQDILHMIYYFCCCHWKSKCWLKSSLWVYFALCLSKKINCSSYRKTREIIKYARKRVFTKPYSTYKDRIYGSVLTRANTGQWKPVFWHILCSISFYLLIYLGHFTHFAKHVFLMRT